MAEHISVNAILSADQVERIQQYMKESNVRFFSDGVREYVRHLEAKVSVSRKHGDQPGKRVDAKEAVLA